MATVPLSGTNIRLLSGVPFNNDYKNTRWFDNKTSQTNYFLNKKIVHSITQANFQRIEGYNFISVNKSIEDLRNTNYVMFQNASYENKWFYGFVTRLEYKQRNTTWVHFQIDVFQTWLFEMNFRPSYILREHCDLWNSDGTPVINTLDEGLEYGSDYETVSVENYQPNNGILYLVIVSKSVLHTNENENVATMNGLPQPLSYYIHPFKLDGSTPNVSGGGVTPIIAMLTYLYSLEPSVNNIVSLYITDFTGDNIPMSGDTLQLDTSKYEIVRIPEGDAIPYLNTIYVKNVENYTDKTKNFGNKYNDFHSVNESKLLMYPYCLTILDDFKGNRTVIKNEYIDSKDLKIRVKGSMGTSNKISYSVDDYLSENLNDSEMITQSLQHAVINNNSNDVPIITDMLSAYLQGNRNSIENQRASIIWNGVMNTIGSAIGGVASGMQKSAVGVASASQNILSGGGNIQLQLQAIEAKQQDINNIPPQLVKMGGNTSFDFGNGYNGVYIIKKQITKEYRKKLSDYFNMFGYKINEIKTPNFHTRKYWNYVQTLSCNITGDFNNEDLTELKSVFDNGITLWHTDDIGNYGLDNEVI